MNCLLFGCFTALCAANIRTFSETAKKKPRKNWGRFSDKQSVALQSADLRPNFKPLTINEDFSVERYAFGVYRELHQALEGLVEEV